MFTRTYPERKTCLQYAAGKIIGYLEEKVVENYQPEATGIEEEPEPWPVAYQYTGTEPDGGTIMPCSNPEDYGQVTNAIIRTRYTESDENAIHRHRLQCIESPSSLEEAKLQQYDEEWHSYNDFCENAKAIARSWIE